MSDVENAAEQKNETSKDEDAELLKESRDGLRERVEAEFEQRKQMKDDLRFAALDQWPAELRADRENDVVNGSRPCLTIDQINQYITQVSNEMLRNSPAIKTRPVDDTADVETAKVFQGLIRHIEDQSSAKIAYQTSGESAVTIGLGFVRVRADYVAPDSFDQDLIIERVSDTFTTYLGKHKMPDGSDADKAWVLENMPIETFKRQYPDAKYTAEDFEGLGEAPPWQTAETIAVCEYYYKEYTDATLLYLANGKTMFEDAYKAAGEKTEITGKRKTQKIAVKWCKHTGCEVLDRKDWPGQYIPIAEEVGKEKIVEGKRMLWGLVRPAKDSLRAFNYWISALTEKMALAPKAPFIGAVGQFATMGDAWDRANRDNLAKLEYDAIDINGNALPAPRRQEPMQMEPAMAHMLQMMQNNVKSSLGMYKAALGDTESQQSGRAILALQKESDTGTMHFGENQALTITHVGRILVDVIPKFYDTKRVLRILGEDGKPQNVQIDPEQKEPVRQVMDGAGKIKSIYNLGVGKYDVTVTVGPGYATSRQEAATVMTDLANTAKDPASAAILHYGAIKNSDFHGSEEIIRMLKAMLPPQALQADDPSQEMPPQAKAKIEELSQRVHLQEQAGQKLAAENQTLKTGAAQEQAKIAADREAALAAHQLKVDLAVKDEEFNVWKAKLDAEKAILVAEIGAKTALRTTAIKAASDADVALSTSLGGEPGADGQPAEPVTPIAQLTQLHKQGMDQHAQSMDQLATGLTQALANIGQILQQSLSLQQQTLAAIHAPKRTSISGVQKDANGNIIGATVNHTPVMPVGTMQ